MATGLGRFPTPAPAPTTASAWTVGPFPDPASRFQPEGPHGPSEVIDPGGFECSHAIEKRDDGHHWDGLLGRPAHPRPPLGSRQIARIRSTSRGSARDAFSRGSRVKDSPGPTTTTRVWPLLVWGAAASHPGSNRGGQDAHRDLA